MIELNSVFQNRYRIDRYIGKGGMADVYRATDLITRNNVAIKICRDDVMNKEEMFQRFLYEIKIASAIQNHFNIVKIYDYGKTVDGLPYMVTEYLNGQTLRDIIDIKRNMSLYETCYLMSQLLDGLNELHSRGIIHRDIKPQNIYLLPDNRVKIADFGISIFVSEVSNINEVNKIVGTPQYIAPEIALGKKASFLSDIYSAGITFFELLVGFVPFNGETPQEILNKHINSPLPNVSNYRTSIPSALVKIVNKACEKNTKLRYQNVLEFKNDIIELLKDKKRLRTQNWFERLFGLKGK